MKLFQKISKHRINLLRKTLLCSYTVKVPQRLPKEAKDKPLGFEHQMANPLVTERRNSKQSQTTTIQIHDSLEAFDRIFDSYFIDSIGTNMNKIKSKTLTLTLTEDFQKQMVTSKFLKESNIFLKLLHDLNFSRVQGLRIDVDQNRVFQKLLIVCFCFKMLEPDSMEQVEHLNRFYSGLFEFQVQEVARRLLGYVPSTLQLSHADLLEKEFHRPWAFTVSTQELDSILGKSHNSLEDMASLALEFSRLFEIDYERNRLHQSEVLDRCMRKIHSQDQSRPLQMFSRNFQVLHFLSNWKRYSKDVDSTYLEYALLSKLESIVFHILVVSGSSLVNFTFQPLSIRSLFFKSNFKGMISSLGLLLRAADPSEEFRSTYFQRMDFQNLVLSNSLILFERVQTINSFHRNYDRIKEVVKITPQLFPEVQGKYDAFLRRFRLYKEYLESLDSFTDCTSKNKLTSCDVKLTYSAEGIYLHWEEDNISDSRILEYVQNLRLLAEQADKSSDVPEACVFELLQLFYLLFLSGKKLVRKQEISRAIVATISQVFEQNLIEKLGLQLAFHVCSFKNFGLISANQKKEAFYKHFEQVNLDEFSQIAYFSVLKFIKKTTDSDLDFKSIRDTFGFKRTRSPPQNLKESMERLLFKLIQYPSKKGNMDFFSLHFEEYSLFDVFPGFGKCVQSDTELFRFLGLFLSFNQNYLNYFTRNLYIIYYKLSGFMGRVVDCLETRLVDRVLLNQVLRTFCDWLCSSRPNPHNEAQVFCCLRLLKLFERNPGLVGVDNYALVWKLLMRVNFEIAHDNIFNSEEMFVFRFYFADFDILLDEETVKSICSCQVLAEEIVHLLYLDEGEFFSVLETLMTEYFNHSMGESFGIDWVQILEPKMNTLDPQQMDTSQIQVVLTLLARSFTRDNQVEQILSNFLVKLCQYFETRSITQKDIHFDRVNLNQIQLMLLWFNSVLFKNQHIQQCLGFLEAVPLSPQPRVLDQESLPDFFTYYWQIRFSQGKGKGIYTYFLSVGKFSFCVNDSRGIDKVLSYNVSNFALPDSKTRMHPLQFVFPKHSVVDFLSVYSERMRGLSKRLLFRRL